MFTQRGNRHRPSASVTSRWVWTAATASGAVVAAWTSATGFAGANDVTSIVLSIAVPVTLVKWMTALGYPPRRVASSPVVWCCAVEFALVVASIGLSYIPDWWSNGDRVTGTILEIGPHGRATIRDPATELEVVFTTWFGNVGDTATAVVLPSDRSRAASPGELKVYRAGWWALVGLATIWPLLCLVAWRHTRSAPTSEAPSDECDQDAPRPDRDTP